jgi:tRNA 2-thiouridine synthesizing protein A
METGATSALGHEIFHDLGELSCGDLIMALLKAIRPLSPGTVMEVRALDPGAPIDIRAWCRLSGHTLLAGPCGPDDAHYAIRKGGTS